MSLIEMFPIEKIPLQIIDGDRGSSYPKSSDFLSKGHCLFLNAGNVTSSGFSFRDTAFIDERKDNELGKGKLKRGDIILTTRGTVGNVSIFSDDVPYENIRINSGMVILRPEYGKVDSRFLYFVLTSRIFKAQVEIARSGSAQPQLPIRDLNKIKIPLPDFSTQKEIAKILGDLDRKIELNRRMNETLEQIGQALFKKYFVDNLEKENWQESQIAGLADYKKITRKPQEEKEEKFLHYSIPAFDNGLKADTVSGSEIKSNKYQVTDHSILVSKLNPSTPRIWPVFGVDSNAICSTEFVVLKPKKYYAFLYFLLNSRMYQETMIAAAGGTSNSHKRVSPEFINSFPFPTPPEDLLEEFELATKNFLIKRDSNIKTNKVLAELRDSLLPKLISGEIKL